MRRADLRGVDGVAGKARDLNGLQAGAREAASALPPESHAGRVRRVLRHGEAAAAHLCRGKHQGIVVDERVLVSDECFAEEVPRQRFNCAVAHIVGLSPDLAPSKYLLVK